jgi:uncharacterized protein YaaN involved in tellurite resistance
VEIERRAAEKVAELERQVVALERRKADLFDAISIIEPTIAAGRARIEQLTAQTGDLEAKLAEAEAAERRLATAREGLADVEARTERL